MPTIKSPRLLTNLLEVVTEYWYPTQLIVVRLSLLLLFLSSLIPKFGSYVLENGRIGTSLIIFIAFLGFEVLIARRDSERSKRNKILQTRELTDELRVAFSSRDVKVDIFCYSSETFFALFVPLFFDLQKMHAHRIQIRLLLRDYAEPFIIPCDEAGRENHEYRDAVVQRNEKIISEFFSNIERAKRTSPGKDVQFEVRAHRLEPLHKGIIINNRTLYWAFYPIIQGERMLGGERKKIWDYEGHSARMVEINFDGPPEEAEIFQSITGWFDIVWRNLSRPITEDNKPSPRTQ